MNKVILTGRLTRDPESRESEVGGKNSYVRFTIATDREWIKDKNAGVQTADFIQCIAFGRTAEHISNWYHKGSPITITDGRIQTGRYVNKDGVTVYTTDVVVNNVEFAIRDNSAGAPAPRDSSETRRDDSFVDVPEGSDEELPFN